MQVKFRKSCLGRKYLQKLFVSLQPIYTEIKPNKMAEESNNEFHNVVPLQIRFNDVDKFGHVNNTIYFSSTTLVRLTMSPPYAKVLTGIAMLSSW